MDYRKNRTRHTRDRCESICWTWLGHRLFILIFDNYIEIGNESSYRRIKVLIKKKYANYFLNTIFKLQNKNHTSSMGNGHCSPPQRSLDISCDKGGNECCPLRHQFSNEPPSSLTLCVYFIDYFIERNLLFVNCVPKIFGTHAYKIKILIFPLEILTVCPRSPCWILSTMRIRQQ